MNTLAIILFSLLCLIGLAHLVWAMGVTWPYRDEKSLARAVVGTRDIEKMPPRWASVFVAIFLFIGGVWALSLRQLAPITIPQTLNFLGGAGLAAIFGLRGVFGIFPAFEKMSPEQPFLRLNRRYYSPLCFLIGVGFALLALSIPNWGWRFSH